MRVAGVRLERRDAPWWRRRAALERAAWLAVIGAGLALLAVSDTRCAARPGTEPAVQTSASPPPAEAASEPVAPAPHAPVQRVTIDGVAVTASPGAAIEVVRETTDAGGREDRAAAGKGAALRAVGDKIETEFNASAPAAGLTREGGTASGGATSIDAAVTGLLGFSPLLLLGALLLAAAVAALHLGQGRTALYLGGAGAGLLLIAFFPSLLLLAALVAAGGAALWWADRRGLLSTEALETVTVGLEAAEDDVRRAAKRSIAHHAGERARGTIRRVKLRAGYGSET